jgi:hypothetical protein
MTPTLGTIIGASVLVFEVSENGEKKEKREVVKK